VPALWASTGASGAAVGTATIAANVFTITSHGLVDGQTVVTSSPTGGAVGVLVPGAPYYVASATTNTFQLRPSPGAPVMTISTGGAVVDAAEAVYDPTSLRRAMGGLLYKGRTAAFATGRFNARWGLLHNSGSAQLSVSGLTVTVQDINAVVQTSGSSSRGPYLVAIPSSQHTLATAHASLTRVDLLIAEVLDNAADASGDLIPGRTRVITGTPGSGAPATPAGTLEIATFSIPAGSGTATETITAQYTVAAGGVLPVTTTAALPDSVVREGMYADIADLDRLERYSGGVWHGMASRNNFDYVQALTGGASVTGWTSYTPTWTGIGTASFSNNVGRWQRIGPKTVEFKFWAVVSTAGSGSSNVQVTAPFNPSRVMNQTGLIHVEGSPTPALRQGLWISFTSGTGATLDRLRMDNGLGSVSNLVGSDLVTALAITGGGVIMEV
jgi:hypothetical protein